MEDATCFCELKSAPQFSLCVNLGQQPTQGYESNFEELRFFVCFIFHFPIISTIVDGNLESQVRHRS